MTHHEDDGGVGDQLNGDGEALALLHAEAADARHAHQRVRSGVSSTGPAPAQHSSASDTLILLSAS